MAKFPAPTPTLENLVVLTWLRLVHSLKLTLDTGAETSMTKASVAHSIAAPIVKTSQQALQADGVTPLVVVGETHLTLSRAGNHLTLDALVVQDLDVDVLAGTPFMISNDISVCPAKGQVLIQGSEILAYHPESSASSQAHAVRRTQSFVLRCPPLQQWSSLGNILSWTYHLT